MEQGKKTEYSQTEKQVCNILLFLSNIIQKSNTYDGVLLGGVRKKRSAIALPPSPCRLEKKPRPAASDSSPTSPLSVSSSECDETLREELMEKINKLVETRESLTKEIGNLKAYYNKLEDYNKVLKAKQQEVKLPEKELKSDMNERSKIAPSTVLLEKFNQNCHPCSSLALSNKTTPATSSQPRLPSLNCPVKRVPYFGPYKIQARRVFKKARDAEARRRRMRILREKKLDIASIKTSKS